MNALTKEGALGRAQLVPADQSLRFRYSRNGTNQGMGLGSTEEKPLSDARGEAAMLRVKVKRGEDPIAASARSRRSARSR